eukprot:364759-Chlamydomonas_euryale.AAC.28
MDGVGRWWARVRVRVAGCGVRAAEEGKYRRVHREENLAASRPHTSCTPGYMKAWSPHPAACRASAPAASAARGGNAASGAHTSPLGQRRKGSRGAGRESCTVGCSCRSQRRALLAALLRHVRMPAPM